MQPRHHAAQFGAHHHRFVAAADELALLRLLGVELELLSLDVLNFLVLFEVLLQNLFLLG